MSDNFHSDSEEEKYFLYDLSRQNSFPEFYNQENFNPIQTETNNSPDYILVPEPQIEEKEKKENFVEEKENSLTAEKTTTKTSDDNKNEDTNKNEDNNKNENNNKNKDNNNSNNNKEKNEIKFTGRKRKSDRDERNEMNDLENNKKKEKEHTKFDDDNKMRKIKSYYAQFLVRYANASISPGHSKFVKIDKDLNRGLTININLKINKMKLKDIFSRYKISKKYSREKYEENYNAQLVEKIYSEGTETKAIERLNQTYIEVLDIMRTNYLNHFKADILKKEINNGEKKESAKMHVEQLVDLLFQYENWFSSKKARPLRNKRNCYN